MVQLFGFLAAVEDDPVPEQSHRGSWAVVLCGAWWLYVAMKLGIYIYIYICGELRDVEKDRRRTAHA